MSVEKDANGSFAESQVNQEMTVNVAIYRVTNHDDGTWEHKEIKRFAKKFVFDDAPQRPQWAETKDLKFIPDTKEKASDNTEGWTDKMTVLDPTENVTVTEDHWSGQNTIIAKFSKTDRYDLQSLLNSASVSPSIRQKSMKSSALKRRKISAMQYTPDGLASNAVAEAFYWFIPARKQLYLEATSANMTADGIALNIAKGSTTNTETVKIKAYYLDDNKQKTYIDLNQLGLRKGNIVFGDKYVAAIDGDITISTDGMEASFVVSGTDNGTTSMTIRTEKTNKVEQTDESTAETAINYTSASTTVNVNVSGGDNLMPPTITPASQNYGQGFDATVNGYDGVKTYWLLINQGGVATSDVSNEGQATASDGKPMSEQELITAVKKFDPTDKQTPAAGTITGYQTATTAITANANANYTLCAIAVTEDADGKTDKLSRMVWSQYVYTKIEAPTLTPGVEGESRSYPFSGDLAVEANVESQNAKIYYTVDEPLSFNINANGTVTTNGHLFDSSKPIAISTTSTVQAIAYSDTLGIKSDIVTYRYAKKTSEINEPTFIIDNSEYTNGDKYTSHSKDKTTVTLRATYYDTAGKLQHIGGDKAIDWDNDKYHIYYTTDGSNISASSLRYTGPFETDNPQGNVKITAVVYADGEGGDHSISDISVLYVLDSGIAYWETSETNCPGGVLNNRDIAITDGNNTLVDIEFGGSKDATSGAELKWKHYTSKEYATGNPIDNIGKYTIAPALDADEDVADVRDEMGNLWNHSRANDRTESFQTHKATYGLPASGAYVKFEPRQSGRLTIWCCQEGALFYSNRSTDKASFNEGFLRKRPAYFVDEAGRSIKPATVEAAGVLSSNWNKAVSPGFWNEKGSEVNGVKQTLYTSRQTEKIYNMFNSVILARGAELNSPVQPLIVYLNTEENKTVAGFNVAEDPKNESEDDGTNYAPDPIVDGTGVCLPSASYMKYTFDVEAGKTYFFFGWMTKIGIRGFGFEPDNSTEGQDVTVYSGQSGTTEGGNSNANDFTQNVGHTYSAVTVDRKFKANTWTTLVLPFSVSANKVKDVFGDNAKILHYRTIDNNTMYFFEHFHQMIVAGTPVLIKPSKDVDKPVFANVTIESATADDRPCDDYGFNGTTNTECQMRGSYTPQTVNNGNYYISTSGTAKRLNAKAGSAPLYGTRAYIVGTKDDGTPVTLSRMARMAYNDLTPTSMDGNPTDIDIVDIDGTGDTNYDSMGNGKVFDINGRFVGTSAKGTNGLAKGVYIVDGKKVTIK